MGLASTGNSITGLRLVATTDWNRTVERVSLMEQVLQRDPAGVYGHMDFASRDRYRQSVEELAEPTGEAQVRVALRAVESARRAWEKTPQDSSGAIGPSRSDPGGANSKWTWPTSQGSSSGSPGHLSPPT